MRGVDGTPGTCSQGRWCGRGFFDVLGVTPIAGRTFLAAASRPRKHRPLVVVGEGLWRRRFGSDPGLVGREVVIEGQSLTVVGVMPADFQLAAPFVRGGAASPDVSEVWGGRLRVKPGVVPRTNGALRARHRAAQARHHLGERLQSRNEAVIAAEAAREVPQNCRRHGIVIEPLRRADHRP